MTPVPQTAVAIEQQEQERISPEQAKLPAAARDLLWLLTSADSEMAPPSNFGAMVAAISSGGKGGVAQREDDWHTVHKTGSGGSSCAAGHVAPRAFEAARKARRVQRAIERTYGCCWRFHAHVIAGWLLEAGRLPSLGIAAGAAPLTHAAHVGWARYLDAARCPSKRSPQSLNEWLVRLDQRARAGKPVEARLAKSVAREAEEILRRAIEGLGRTR